MFISNFFDLFSHRKYAFVLRHCHGHAEGFRYFNIGFSFYHADKTFQLTVFICAKNSKSVMMAAKKYAYIIDGCIASLDLGTR